MIDPVPSDRCALSQLMNELSLPFLPRTAAKGECTSFFQAAPLPLIPFCQTGCSSAVTDAEADPSRCNPTYALTDMHKYEWVSCMTHLALPPTQAGDPRTIRLFFLPFLTSKLGSIP